LLLETSSQPGVVALAEGERLVGVRRLDEARRHARDLAPAVGDLLAQEGWRPRDVQLVVVSRGPGSYTGLRVGLVSAKAFAYATGCRLVALETFAVIAAQAPAEADRLAVLADAQQDKVYVQEFERLAPGGPLSPSSHLTIQPIGDWCAAHAEPLWVSGPGLRKFADKLPAHLIVVEATHWDPQPETMLHQGLKRAASGEYDDLYALEPLYLRPSAAEEQWKKRK
jgi:tRNA threonylcarbamoyladenosine biosynthesis protein TsaB